MSSLDRAFGALADPTRRSILAELATGEQTVNDLVAKHELSQPAITKHLKVLENAGLIRRGKVGQTRPCALEPEGLKLVAGWVDANRERLGERLRPDGGLPCLAVVFGDTK